MSVSLWLIQYPLDLQNQPEESIESSDTKEREERRAISNKGQRRALSVQRLQTEKSVDRSESCVERSIFCQFSSPASSTPSSVKQSILRRPFHTASSDSSSFERPVLRRAIFTPSSVLSCKERSVLRRVLRPSSTDLGSKNVKIPVASVRVPLRLRDSVKKRTSARQRRVVRTDCVLRRSFQALCPATA